MECASYDADLALWRSLAQERGGPVLDLGAGTGRVALDLAARGHEVTAVDLDPDLVAACAERAAARGLPVTAVAADARTLALERRHPLAILPMQVAQLMGSDEGRAAMLERLLGALEPGGLVAVALADPFEGIPPEERAAAAARRAGDRRLGAVLHPGGRTPAGRRRWPSTAPAAPSPPRAS